MKLPTPIKKITIKIIRANNLLLLDAIAYNLLTKCAYDKAILSKIQSAVLAK